MGVVVEPIDLDGGPLEVLARWPRTTPVSALISETADGRGAGTLSEGGAGGGGAARWSRWSVLAPIDAQRVRTLSAQSVMKYGSFDSRRAVAEEAVRAAFAAPTAAGDRDAGTGRGCGVPQPPYRVIGLAYELGRVLEPSDDPRRRVARGEKDAGDGESTERTRFAPDVPLVFEIECLGALVFDRLERRWWVAASQGAEADRLRELVRWVGPGDAQSGTELEVRGDGFALGPLRSTMGHDAFVRAVREALELIREGDVFQVNLSHELRGELRGDRRGLFRGMCGTARPWFGAYVELPAPWSTIASVSPELFLDFDACGRRVTTRPIKGTRAISESHGTGGAWEIAAATEELRRAEKDSAELNMIVDLLRNDLGRVCEFGSVRVEEARGIESHAVMHAVATVVGRLGDKRSAGDLVLAAYPGGSITGAPKVRAMQVIESLEGRARGMYCGTIALMCGDGSFTSSIAIRTATITRACSAEDESASDPAVVRFPVGAGIVADSDPEAEWRETLDKAGAVLALAGRQYHQALCEPEVVERNSDSVLK